MMNSEDIEQSGSRFHSHSMPFGPRLLPEGRIRFRLWAPGAEKVELCLFKSESELLFFDMAPLADGWFQTDNSLATSGSLYQFRINGDLLVPDPASRYQPNDIHGPSQVIAAEQFDWQHSRWPGRPWEEVILYELHVGTFTAQGTFAGVEAQLDYLTNLGITAIELMPVADFPGRHNWGYDGALLYAPDSMYGKPDDLRRLIRTAHQKDLMVFLDVVFNHFGPEGNYLHVYAKDAFFQQDVHTPWGAAINFSGPRSRTVRDFFIHNVLYWLEEFQFDGLRFDAVHGIMDDSEPHILKEIADVVARGPGRKRHIHLVLENDKNEAHYLARKQSGSPMFYTAQWNDDIHHALHILLTGENTGYYQDYAGRPIDHLGRCLTQGFAFQGEPSPYRNNQCRGEPSFMLPLAAFVSFMQNHDQVGNRAFGERLTVLSSRRKIFLAAALMLLSPSPPLLFMGEEFWAQTPFYYFCDFEDDLAEAVRSGRRREFARFPQFSDPAILSLIPDPNNLETVERSCIDWRERDTRPGRQCHEFYKKLLTLRKEFVIPCLPEILHGKAFFRIIGPEALDVTWTSAKNMTLRLLVNFADNPVTEFEIQEGSQFFSFPEEKSADIRNQILSAQSIHCFLVALNH